MPWVRSYIGRKLHLPPSALQPPENPQDEASLPLASLGKHSLIVGTTGSGKSRSTLHVLQSLLEEGHSVVLLDPKGETLDHLLAYAVSSGYPANRIVLFDPANEAAGVPGLNPFLTGLPLAQIVADFLNLIAQASSSWGPRLQNLLVNTCLIVGTHRLSPYEIVRFLLRDDYRQYLLSRSVTPKDPYAYREALNFFTEEFANWSKAERSGAVAPVTNKLAELLRSPYLRPLLTAKRNTVDLRRLWRQSYLILVRLDRSRLGEEALKLLAGLLINLLLRTALRSQRGAPVPVTLAVDELPQVERLVGPLISDIVTLARSQGLSCLLACQHLDQLSDKLRSTLVSQCSVQLYFRLGYTDAKLIATSVCAGATRQITRYEVTRIRVDANGWAPPDLGADLPIVDDEGCCIHLEEERAKELGIASWGGGVSRLIEAAAEGLSEVWGWQLNVFDPGTRQLVPLQEFVARFEPRCLGLSYGLLRLTVRSPRPQVRVLATASESDQVRDLTRTIQSLPVQHALLRLDGQAVGIVKIQNVPNRHIRPLALAYCVARASAANSQGTAEIAATIAARQRAVDKVGRSQRPAPREFDDGSIH